MSLTEPDKDDPFAEGVAAAKARRMRSVMIAVVLAGLVVIFFAVTILKLAANAAHVVPQT
jgi:hypothetical protein